MSKYVKQVEHLKQAKQLKEAKQLKRATQVSQAPRATLTRSDRLKYLYHWLSSLETAISLRENTLNNNRN